MQLRYMTVNLIMGEIRAIETFIYISHTDDEGYFNL